MKNQKWTVSWSVRQQAVGEQLRALRTKAQLSLDEAASVIHCSVSKLSRVETGYRSASIEDIASLLTLYRADQAHRTRVLALARGDDETGWVQPTDSATSYSPYKLSGLESRAEYGVYFDPVAVPRLLQTTEYQSAVLTQSATGPGYESDHGHQVVSVYRPAPALHAIVEESVLYRPFGGRQVLRGQLLYLRDVARYRSWSVRVLPWDQTLGTDAFTLLRVSERSSVVILNHLTCRLFLERPEDVQAYEQTLKRLEAYALDESASLALITKAAAELEE